MINTEKMRHLSTIVYHIYDIHIFPLDMYLIDPSNGSEQGGLPRELLQALFVDVDGGERLVEAEVDFAQVQVCVHIVLLLQCRLELLLSIAVHAESAQVHDNTSTV